MTDSKRLSQERYTQFADGYVRSVTHARGADLDLLVELAQPQADWQVLDVATGGGHTALKFAPHVKRVTASDLTPAMLDKARDFIIGQGVTTVDFKLADAEHLPFEAAQFDLVTCRIAPHHFPDIGQFVREATRVLVEDGILLVQDHVLPDDDQTASVVDGFEKRRDPSHHHALSRSAWIDCFEKAGLTVTNTREMTKRHHLIEWAKRQGNDDETIQTLRQIVTNASDAVRGWMQPQAWQTNEASFVNHHILIMGRKYNSQS